MNDNLRIIFDNAADRGSLIASSQAGALVAENLRNEKKTYLWRGTTLTESLNLIWPTAEPIGGIVLAFNNFTPNATMRARGWANVNDEIPRFDTGVKLCQPMPTLKYMSLLNPIGENAYTPGGIQQTSFGAGGYGVLWVPSMLSVRRLLIEISDPTNPAGYIEASRLVVGRFWQPQYNFDFGHGITYHDGGKAQRSEGGEIRNEQGAKWRSMNLSLSYLDPVDRANFIRIARTHGTTKPLFVSAFPENEDRNLEQVYQLWGQFADKHTIRNPRNALFATQIQIEEM